MRRMGKIDSMCSFRITLLTRTKWPDARIREELSPSMGRFRREERIGGENILRRGSLIWELTPHTMRQ